METNPGNAVAGLDEASRNNVRPADSGWRSTVRQILGLDLRSLAALRIGLGLIVLTDLGIRATDLVAHYTDAGVLPRGALLQMFNRPYRFSLHFTFGETGPIAGLFLLQGVIALLLMVGYRTKVMTVLSWILLVSLHNRNPLLLNAGDQLLALFLFWGMFLPLGARWSLDSRGRDHRDNPQPLTSMATVALIAQVCLVYVFTVFHKTGDAWREGAALFYALHADLFVTRMGIWLRDLHWPLKPLTYAAFYWEMLGPLLVLIPWRNSWFRTLAVFGFVVFHAGIGLSMSVGLFSLVSMVGWIALIPGGVWDWLARRVGSNWKVGQRLQERMASVWKRGQTRWPVLGRSGSIRLRTSPIGSMIVALLLIYVVGWNLRTLNHDRFVRYFPAALDPIAHALRLDQKWNMFAPAPMTDDGWYIIETELRNGEVVDLLRGGAPISLDKPDYVLKWIPNRRWGKYWMRIKTPTYKLHRPYYARYLMRKWNREHDAGHQMESLRIYFMLEETAADGPLPPRMVMLWYHPATDGPAAGEQKTTP